MKPELVLYFLKPDNKNDDQVRLGLGSGRRSYHKLLRDCHLRSSFQLMPIVFWVVSGVQWIKSPLLANFINRIKNFLCIIDNVSVYLVVKINVQLSAIPTYNMINQDKQLFPSVSSIFQPLAWAADERGPGPSPPNSITSWNYCCKSNVKVNLGDYNPSTHGGRIIF